MKRFWLIYRKEDALKNKSYIELYQSYAPKFDLQCELIFVEDLRFGVQNEKIFLSQQDGIPLPDFAVVRTIYPSLNRQLELLGIPCRNSFHVSSICNDKAETYRYLSGKGIAMPDTVFVANRDIPSFLHKEKISNHSTGTVMKATDGHGGSQVLLYDGDDEAVLCTMGRSDLVVQKRIGIQSRDLRVYVIGNQILAAVLRESQSDFRANFSLGGEVSLYSLKKEEETLVHKIMEQFRFDMVGIDFIPDADGKLVFNEIEDVVGARMLYRCSNIDIVREYLDYLHEL